MNKKKLYIETYGCQMNVADSEVVASILEDDNYVVTSNIELADLVLINTCSIRENAEQKIWNRVDALKYNKRQNKDLQVGIIGCMAERLGAKLTENKVVSIVGGPDSYRKLPDMLKRTELGFKVVNVDLITEETYSGIVPKRLEDSKLSGFISISRGCNNFCTYCIVPYTRGRERSRDYKDILIEARKLIDSGYKEITLIGQNVNSYNWSENNVNVDFPDLLKRVSELDRSVRIRFTTSHPKDISDKLINVVAETSNVCNHFHLPVQSGSSKILKLMNRKYDREWYLERINSIKTKIPDCGITTDIFCGFHSETEDDHNESLSLMEAVGYDWAFMFKYSQREGTYAAKHLPDNIPEDIKAKRLREIIDLQHELSIKSNNKDIGKSFTVLAEGVSKKSSNHLFGRTQHNKVTVFPKGTYSIGDFVNVRITNCTSATLIGELI